MSFRKCVVFFASPVLLVLSYQAQAAEAVPVGGAVANNAPASAAHDPSNVKLKVSWTKDQLKEAPDFQYYKAPSGMATTPSPSTTGAAPPANPRPRTQ